MRLALVIHALAAVIWVGGMFFAVVCVRPAASSLPIEMRAPLWVGTFERFFPWVIGAIATLLASGFYMIFWLGGPGAVGPSVHVMITLGIIMMLIFGHVFFAPYRRLKAAVAQSDWETAGRALGLIRKMFTLNLAIGLVTAAAGAIASIASFE